MASFHRRAGGCRARKRLQEVGQFVTAIRPRTVGVDPTFRDALMVETENHLTKNEISSKTGRSGQTLSEIWSSAIGSPGLSSWMDDDRGRFNGLARRSQRYQFGFWPSPSGVSYVRPEDQAGREAVRPDRSWTTVSRQHWSSAERCYVPDEPQPNQWWRPSARPHRNVPNHHSDMRYAWCPDRSGRSCPGCG